MFGTESFETLCSNSALTPAPLTCASSSGQLTEISPSFSLMLMILASLEILSARLPGLRGSSRNISQSLISVKCTISLASRSLVTAPNALSRSRKNGTFLIYFKNIISRISIRSEHLSIPRPVYWRPCHPTNPINENIAISLTSQSLVPWCTPLSWRDPISLTPFNKSPNLCRTHNPLTLGAEGVLPSRQIESFLRVFKQFAHTLPSRQVVG